jgi:hypothetical protein
MSIKNTLRAKVETWMANNLNCVITPYLLFEAYWPCLQERHQDGNFCNCIQKIGLYPCNHFISRDHDFAVHSQHKKENYHASNE